MTRLFRVFVPASTLALVAFETVVVLATVTLSIYLWGDVDPRDYLLNTYGLVNVALFSASFLIGIYFQDLYDEVHVQSRLLLLQQLLMADGIAFILQAMVSAANSDLHIPLRIMLYSSVMAIAIIFTGRLFFSGYVIPRLPGERLLLLGESPLLDDITAYLNQHPETGLQVAGHIRQLETTSPPTSLEERFRPFESKRLIVGMHEKLTYQVSGELLDLRFQGYSIQDAAEAYAKVFNREGLSDLDITRLVYAEEFDPNARALFFQAVRNWLIAAVCLIVLSPLMLLIAILVRLSGPILDRRKFCGRHGGLFTLYQFRVRGRTDGGQPGATGWLGRLLGRTGLYALPQLVNVLLGQMSMVGPRPLRTEIAAEMTRHIPFYPHRFNVLPGMTGWAQILGRRLPGLRDGLAELEYDLYYIKYISATTDIFLMLQALKNILVWGAQPQ